MKKMFIMLSALCFILSACIPAALQPQATSPAPVSDTDIQATVAVQVEQTIQSLPTLTPAPSNTPVIITATSAPTQTATQVIPTSTTTATQATLTVVGTGTIVPAGTAGTLPSTATSIPVMSATPVGTAHRRYYGTMPPNLPSGSIVMLNMSKADAYISLQCTTSEGYVTVIEYPVGGSTVGTSAPAGQYVYVAWIGGKKFTGSFKLGKLQDRKIIMYKDRVEVK
jgi:hypothetical protein